MAASTRSTPDHDPPSIPRAGDDAMTQEPGANQPNNDIVSAVMLLVTELRAKNQNFAMEPHGNRLQHSESAALTTRRMENGPFKSTEEWARFEKTYCEKGLDIAVYGLLKAVDENPGFWLQPDEGTGLTVLHFAVLVGYHELVEKVLEKLKVKAEEDNTSNSRIISRPTAVDYFHQTDAIDGLSAVKLSSYRGHPKILKCFLSLPSCFLVGIEMAYRFDLENELELWLEQQEFHDKWMYSQSIREMEWFEVFENWVEETGSKNLTTALHWAVKELSEEDLENFVIILCESDESDQKLLQFLTFRDRLGRTPLHVAVDEETKCDFKQIVDILEKYFPKGFDLNVTDFVGKTPLHWAGVFGYSQKVAVLVQAPSTNLDATFTSKIIESRIRIAGTKPGTRDKHFLEPVSGMTVLHLAAFHNHYEVVETLLNAAAEDRSNNAPRVSVNAICQYRIRLNVGDTATPICVWDWQWTPFQLAALKGHVQTLQAFLKSDKIYDSGFKHGINTLANMANMHYNGIPTLHLAAAACHPFAIKVLLGSHKVDVSSVDKNGDTALHYVTRYGGQLVELWNAIYEHHSPKAQIDCSVMYRNRLSSACIKTSAANIIGCMELLMQMGLDMDIENKILKEIPTLHPCMDENVQEWWFTKLGTGMQEEKTSLSMATNAISLTAALVATASFVGPLQPPLGVLLDSDPTWLHGYSQVNHMAVDVFLFCDGLSFYLAIASIMLAMFPSLPIPCESLEHEVKIARRSVQASIVLLFGSIAFVICAFCSATIAIVPQGKWKFTSWTVVSSIVGVFVCAFVLFLSALRFLQVIRPNNRFAGMITMVIDNIFHI